MQITEVRLLVLEDPHSQVSTGHAIAQVPGLRRIQYSHKGRKDGGKKEPAREK